jgi:HKD family nuclease
MFAVRLRKAHSFMFAVRFVQARGKVSKKNMNF